MEQVKVLWHGHSEIAKEGLMKQFSIINEYVSSYILQQEEKIKIAKRMKDRGVPDVEIIVMTEIDPSLLIT